MDGTTAPPPELIVSDRFDSFEAFARAAARWALDFRQLDSGPFDAELTHIVTPAVILGRCRLNRKVEQRGTPPAGYRTFGIAADENLAIRWRGKDVGPHNLMLFPPGDSLHSITEPGFHVFAISVSEVTIGAAAKRHGFVSAEELLPDHDLATCPPKTLTGLRELAGNLTDAAAANPDLIRNRWFRISLEEDLVDHILDAVVSSHGEPQQPSGFETGDRALQVALELIASRAAEPVSIAEIEHLSGASGRTLRYAFEREFGLSPKKYLQAYRLNQVQRELLRADRRESSVRTIAERWGFWHMSQFARDYRRMFGELPSETLTRT